MKLIYLASPYTHKSNKIQVFRYNEITRIAALLELKYKQAMFLPITQSHILRRYAPDLGTTFADWAAIDLKAISRCDEVWVVKLDGWKESAGVIAEIKFAKDNKIPVLYINPKTIRFVKT